VYETTDVEQSLRATDLIRVAGTPVVRTLGALPTTFWWARDSAQPMTVLASAPRPNPWRSAPAALLSSFEVVFQDPTGHYGFNVLLDELDELRGNVVGIEVSLWRILGPPDLLVVIESALKALLAELAGRSEKLCLAIVETLGGLPGADLH